MSFYSNKFILKPLSLKLPIKGRSLDRNGNFLTLSKQNTVAASLLHDIMISRHRNLYSQLPTMSIQNVTAYRGAK